MFKSAQRRKNTEMSELELADLPWVGHSIALLLVRNLNCLIFLLLFFPPYPFSQHWHVSLIACTRSHLKKSRVFSLSTTMWQFLKFLLRSASLISAPKLNQCPGSVSGCCVYVYVCVGWEWVGVGGGELQHFHAASRESHSNCSQLNALTYEYFSTI